MPFERLPPGNPIARPWLVAASLWLALAALATLAVWHLRHDAIGNQGRELRLLSQASSVAIDRGLRGAEEGLQSLRSELEAGRLVLDAAQPEQANQALHARAGLMPLVNRLWVLDAQGRPLAGSDRSASPEAAAFLPGLAGLDRDGVALSRPVPAADGKGDQVAMALRFAGPVGQGGGWIVAAMPASALLGLLAEALPSADARLLALRSDGVRLAGVNEWPGRPGDAGALLRQLDEPGVALHSRADGSEHVVAEQTVARYGVSVRVGRDLDAVLGAWRQSAEGAAAALLVLLVVMAAAVHFVLVADRRRALAQAALQAQVSRAGKLESLGTLAGGVAHDFNNVLAGIIGFGEMAQDAAAPGSAQARHLDKLLQAALRGKALVERILTFSRGGARASEVFELAPVVEEVLSLLNGSLRAGITVLPRLEAPGGRLKGDATQAFEAVMNLCTNAMQAMPDGGVIEVHLGRLQALQPKVLSHTRLLPGRYLSLSVADQGGGITPQVMEHLFEPFFTTKAAQSGTGLGLAVVFGVVAEFGGAVDVQSRPGEGARFTLYLPETDEGTEAAGALPREAGRGSGQRLLVVDDEPELVALAVETLRALGYAPEGHSDPAQALEALRQDPQAYAAVITDEVMPGLTGTQLTQALRVFAPRLPVLLVSGYGGALLAQRASTAGVSRVLAKPIQRASLAQALAEVLGRA